MYLTSEFLVATYGPGVDKARPIAIRRRSRYAISPGIKGRDEDFILEYGE
jgi:hypothetical protein